VARMWEKSNRHGVLVGKVNKRDCLEDLGTNGRTILKWIMKKYGPVE
jgi:hypothetical protein